MPKAERFSVADGRRSAGKPHDWIRRLVAQASKSPTQDRRYEYVRINPGRFGEADANGTIVWLQGLARAGSAAKESIVQPSRRVWWHR